MKSILAFSASKSPSSINQKLILHVSRSFDSKEVQIIDFSQVDIPFYDTQQEKVHGIPKPVKDLFMQIIQADGFIISTPEYNGLPTAFFKNVIDWLSRIELNLFDSKPVLLMSASTRETGGRNSIAVAENLLSLFGANIVARFSCGNFDHSYDEENSKFSDRNVQKILDSRIGSFKKHLGISD